MKKLLGLFSILLFSIAMVGCNTPIDPDCPECPPSIECPEGYEPIDGVCVLIDKGPSCGDLEGMCGQDGVCPEGYEPLQDTWDCTPCCQKVVEPPPPDNDCKRFFVLDQNGTPAPGEWKDDCRGSTGRLMELCYQRQEMVWQGTRSPRHAATYCGDKVGEIGTTPAELSQYASAGEALMTEMDRFYPRLQIESEECPGRSVVNKAMYKDFQARRKQHMTEVYVFDTNATNHVCRETKAYDNMQGWCCECYGRGPNCEEWVQ